METLKYKPKLAQRPTPVLGSLELDLSRLGEVENPNVRGVALSARALREKLEEDPSHNIQGAYSEAYRGEVA